MKDKYRINKVEHIWNEKEDRWIYIEYNEQYRIIGLNFMQGDDYEYFKKNWCYNDQGLMEYYDSMLLLVWKAIFSITDIRKELTATGDNDLRLDRGAETMAEG